MFDAFKAQHGGEGPFQILGDAVTHNHFADRARAGALQQTWRDTVDGMTDDPDLPPEFKNGALKDARSLRNIPTTQALAVLQGLRSTAEVARGAVRSFADFSASQDRLRGHTVGPDDEDQLATLDTQGKMARDMMLSASPETQKNGAALLAGVLQSQRSYAAENETQRIAADNLKASTGIAADTARYERDLKLGNELSDRLKPIDSQLDALATAHAINNNPKADNVQRALAFNQVVTALDPGGRRDPDGRYAGANGIALQLQAAYERAAGQTDQTAFNDVNQIITSASGQLMKQRTRAIDTSKAQTAAYGGDLERVLSNAPEREPLESNGGVSPTPEPDPNKPPPPGSPDALTKAAAAVKATLETANANVPDTAKTAAMTAAGISAPQLVTQGVKSLPVLGVLAAMVAINRKPPDQLPNESDDEYQQRLSAMMAGEDIGLPRAPVLPNLFRNTNTDEYPQ